MSTAISEASAKDILNSIERFRQCNEELDITGMLLRIQENNQIRFVQLLEGEEETVRQLFEKISKDPRHKAVRLVHQANILQRDFSNWSMGFHPIREDHHQQLVDFHFNDHLHLDESCPHCDLALDIMKKMYEFHFELSA